MTHGTLPPVRPDEPDGLDRLFTTFFRQQLPNPWPAFQPVPSAGPAVRQSSVATGRSRATLAVSVAALLGLGLYLSSSPVQRPVGTERKPDAPGLIKDATAKGPDLSKRHHTSSP